MQFWINRLGLLKRSASFAGAALLLSALIFSFSGCSRGPNVIGPFEGDALELGEFKRYEKNMERDFLHHLRRKVYAKPKVRRLPHGELQMIPVTGELLLSDRAQLLEDLGPPTMMRRKLFKSREGERIEEWVYRDDLLVAQFLDGRLVYQGPLSDLETLLTIHGYPDRFSRGHIHPDGEMKVFTYLPLFSAKVSLFKLVNDELVLKQEGG